MEKTSGIEVIKRLVAQGLIHEFSDLTDKRSVRVSITEKGKMEVMNVLPEMSKVSRS
jgi:DNA-binding MarR family transcriptional regulator